MTSLRRPRCSGAPRAPPTAPAAPPPSSLHPPARNRPSPPRSSAPTPFLSSSGRRRLGQFSRRRSSPQAPEATNAFPVSSSSFPCFSFVVSFPSRARPRTPWPCPPPVITGATPATSWSGRTAPPVPLVALMLPVVFDSLNFASINQLHVGN